MHPFYSRSMFTRWLKRLKPRDELVTRMALRHDIREPGVSLKWEARTKALERELIKNEDDMVDLLQAVERARKEVKPRCSIRRFIISMKSAILSDPVYLFSS